MPGSAATIGSMHVCPMVTGYVPHVGGPIVGPGVPTVLIGGKPAAVMGDMCTCVGPPDTIVQGEATVLIGGMPAATMGSMTAHGGSVVQGEPTVLIGTGGTPATAIAPLKKIPFPKINTLQKFQASVVGKAGELKEAEENQLKIAKEAEEKTGEPKVYNVRWLKESKSVKDSKELKTVDIQASVLNIDDGETVDFTINRVQEDGTVIEKELSGTVEAGKVIVTWEIEEEDLNKENA